MRKIAQANSKISFVALSRVTRAHRAATRNDIGQALVELALIFPIFILLLLGAAEFGYLAYAAIEVTNAARAGVAYGAQSHITASDYSGMQTAATNDGPNLGGLSATATNFCACSSAPSTQVSCSTVTTNCSPAPLHSLEYVQVNTTATISPLFNYPGLSKTHTLTGQAIMRVEQ
jgi:Flp pilus assembly protein TadG